MSNVAAILIKPKPCFGQYENWDNSWHCKGCPVSKECQAEVKENQNNET